MTTVKVETCSFHLKKQRILFYSKSVCAGLFDLERRCDINPLKTKRRLLYLKTSSYRAINTFNLGYKNQSVYDISDTSRCLFSDKYKTHKYGVGR